MSCCTKKVLSLVASTTLLYSHNFQLQPDFNLRHDRIHTLTVSRSSPIPSSASLTRIGIMRSEMTWSAYKKLVVNTVTLRSG